MKNAPLTLWIVGTVKLRIVGTIAAHDGELWELKGVYESLSAARRNATGINTFIAPAELRGARDAHMPLRIDNWPGLFWPLGRYIQEFGLTDLKGLNSE